MAPPAASPIAFRAAVRGERQHRDADLTVPAAVQAGDALALVVTTKSGTTHAAPAGWTSVTGGSSTAVNTSVFQKVATATDAGSVADGDAQRADQVRRAAAGLLRHRGRRPVVGDRRDRPGRHHQPPGAGDHGDHAGQLGGLVLGGQVGRDDDVMDARPAGVTARSTAFGTGTTYISSLHRRPGGTSSAIGTVPGPTATTNAASRGAG